MVALLIAALPATYVCVETAFVFLIILLSRLSLTGTAFFGISDAVAGVLLGVGALSMFGLCLLPVVHMALRGRTRRVIVVLLASAVAVAAVGSIKLQPYSAAMPKRVLLNHVQYTEGVLRGVAGSGEEGHLQQEQRAWPEMRLTNAAWAISGTDPAAVRTVTDAMGLGGVKGLERKGSEWLVVYPISDLLDLVSLPAPNVPMGLLVDKLPALRLVSDRLVPAAAAGASDREQQPLLDAELLSDEGVERVASGGRFREVAFEVYTQKPCWGSLRISGQPLLSWELSPESGARNVSAFMAHGYKPVRKVGHGGGGGVESAWPHDLVVKWTNEKMNMVWRVTLVLGKGGVDAAAGGEGDGNVQAGSNSGGGGGGAGSEQQPLKVELHVAYLDRTQHLQEMVDKMPAWSTLSYEATTYVSEWTL